MSIHYSSISPRPGVDAFRRAVDVAGSQQALGAIVGKTQGAVSKRLAAGQPCWAEDVLAVEEATGISRHDLRPDIYPREQGPAGGQQLEGVRP